MATPDIWEIDPDTCTMEELNQAWMSLSEARKYVVHVMGFSDEDLRAGLVAGVVKSTGTADGRGGYRHVEIQIGGLIEWLALLQAKRAARRL